jgi:glucose-6-phosphate isomerase
MLNTIDHTAPAELESALSLAADTWAADNLVSRIWDRDASVWTSEDEEKWLGWLDIIGTELADAQKYRDLSAEIDSEGFNQILLMGMGGSSLCPEVLALTFGKKQFHILDSTVPSQIKHVEEKLDLEKTLFIVASKSGSTLEPNCFKQYFFERLSERVGREKAGRQFVAITDPGSKMEQVARADGFRHIFFGKPQIGGRFSALSAFGMTAAASMGLDVKSFLQKAAEMADACRTGDPRSNPGALLGLLLGNCQTNGRDKLTILTSPEIQDLGAWLEQLIAESTGKIGVSIIPVDREPARPADTYGSDRVFAFLSVKCGSNFDDMYNGVRAAGHPAVKIELDSIENLGQEFFRWEFATAVAGSVMQINPFNQPDVEAAKIEARKITDEYEQTGSLPTETPFYEEDGISLFTSSPYITSLLSAGGRSLKGILAAHLGNIGKGDYFGLLA